VRLQFAVLMSEKFSVQLSYYILDLTGHFRQIFRVEGDNCQQPSMEWKD